MLMTEEELGGFLKDSFLRNGTKMTKKTPKNGLFLPGTGPKNPGPVFPGKNKEDRARVEGTKLIYSAPDAPDTFSQNIKIIPGAILDNIQYFREIPRPKMILRVGGSRPGHFWMVIYNIILIL